MLGAFDRRKRLDVERDRGAILGRKLRSIAYDRSHSAPGGKDAARAEQGERMRRVGVLMSTAADDPESQLRLVAFVQGCSRRAEPSAATCRHHSAGLRRW